MSKSKKGGQFERDISRQLSLWWSGGTDDNVFWRTSNSGGRATVRGKAGKKTANAEGDILASSPDGLPFLRTFCLELKRGYNGESRNTLQDMIDSLPNKGPCLYEKWVAQAEKARALAGAEHWLIIFRKDQRRACVFLREIALMACELRGYDFSPAARVVVDGAHYVLATLDNFLEVVDPRRIRDHVSRADSSQRAQ